LLGQQNEFFDRLDKAATFVIANLLWVALSIPLITLPAATAGLFTTMSPWVRGKPAEVFRDFFSGMRRNWLKASVVGLMDALIGGLVALNFAIFPLMNMAQPLTLLSQSVTLFVALTAVMVNLYLWPLMATLELPFRQLLDTAIRLVFIHPAWSFALLALAGLVASVSLFFLPSLFLLTVTFSGFALLVNWGAWRVIRRYVPEDELAKLEGRT
jgi:uncharacterized membrane protein YesL